MPGEASACRSQALRLLKFRPRTEAELRERLTRKGCRREEIDAVLAEFRQKGLVNDAIFARYFVQQRVLSKPVGRRMLLSKLREKGIPPELAARAVEAGTEGQDERAQARELALKRMAQLTGLGKEAVRRRLFGYLSRRGFSADAVYHAVREATGA